MGAKTTVEIDLADATQRWAQVPIPVRKVGVRGPLEVNCGFSDGKLSFVNLSGNIRRMSGRDDI